MSGAGTMVAAWTAEDSVFRFSSEGLSGSLRCGEAIELELQASTGHSGLSLFRLGSVELEEADGSTRTLMMKPINPYIQGSAVLVPLETAADPGVKLTIRYLLDEPMLTLEVTAQVDRPIARIQATFFSPLSNVPIQLPLARGASTGTLGRQDARVVKVETLGQPIGVFADLGDEGTLTVPPEGEGLCHVLFRQPLEKGVILVGRLAVTRWQDSWHGSGLAEAYRRWFEQDSYL